MGFLRFLLGLAIFLAIVYVGVGYFLPNNWEVSRSTMIGTSTQPIYDYVANLRRWPEWSPWGEQQDSTVQYTYEGSRMGAGSQQNWTSEKMGTGWLRINEADPLTGISYDLFIDMNDMKSELKGDIAFRTRGGVTEVVWTDRGQADGTLMRKWMNQLVRLMLGRDMDEGLAKLKILVEAGNR